MIQFYNVFIPQEQICIMRRNEQCMICFLLKKKCIQKKKQKNKKDELFSFSKSENNLPDTVHVCTLVHHVGVRQ